MNHDGVKFRRNDHDVNNTVKVTDPASVSAAIESIFLDLYPGARTDILRDAVQHIAGLYRGEHPDYAACDTGYHDLQHTLDVTLASARLMDGFERSHPDGKALGDELFTFGILLALFHDSGYLRRRGQEDERHGAEFTLMHVSRGAELVRQYMQKLGMGEMADIAARAIHFTGYEVPAELIQLPSQSYRAIGNIVATADILAQMSDRCYLEKCHDRLYEEFVLAGIASKRDERGNEQVVFSSPQDLVIKTPGFYRGARKRMDETLDSAHQYAGKHFNGQNLYLDAVERNIQFAEYVVAHNADIGMLQRTPPQTPGSDQVSAQAEERKQRVEDRRKRIGDRRQNSAQRYPDFPDRRTNSGDRRKARAES
ncbi:MAG TPA: hypothetical protein VGD24_09520 [Gallionella sp.]